MLACSDPNGDKIALTIVAQARGTARSAALAKATGSVLYTPAPGLRGPDSFTYTRDRRHGRRARVGDGDGDA